MVDHGDVVLAVQINAGFSEQLRKGQTARVQVIVDASNSNTALVSLGYVNQIASKFATGLSGGDAQPHFARVCYRRCRRSCWSGSRGSIPTCAASGFLCRE